MSVTRDNLILLPRPNYRQLKHGLEHVGGARHMVTLLTPHEFDAKAFFAAADAGSVRWTWQPLSVREGSRSAWWIWLRAAQRVQSLLDTGERVVVHCAAGIHRTGTLAYYVGRLDGLTQNEAWEQVFALRSVIRGEIGRYQAIADAEWDAYATQNTRVYET